jgi:hypothetical protein
MPGSPGAGEGVTRTHELLEALLADINTSYEMLEVDRGSRYLRRCTVRAVHSFIDAVLETLKGEIRSTLRLRHVQGLPEFALTPKDLEVLGTLGVFAPRGGKFLPLERSFKATFKLAARVWDVPFQLDTGGEAFRYLLIAKDARNALTHPKTFYDLEVTDEEMEAHTVAGNWALEEFLRLITMRWRQVVELVPVGEQDEMRATAHAAFRSDPDAPLV